MIQDKIQSREAVVDACTRLKDEGKTIGFTSGAFDLVHAGHVDYLEKARALCDVLVVGVNSDASVRAYKGRHRPLVPQEQRMKVVAALASVDYVFVFEERRNKKNIELLKPSFYIKAGDYGRANLTSSAFVEKYGGRVRIIPVEEEVSTTDLIDRISAVQRSGHGRIREKQGAEHIELGPKKQAPGVFLDRDGTINQDVEYLHAPSQFRLLPNALAGIKAFQDMGYRIIILTNQPGIGLGYFAEEDFYRVNREMLKRFSAAGIRVDKIYFCPHSKSDDCSCRKPGQALIERAKEALNLDLEHSVIVGDKTADMETGRRAGMMSILVKTGYGGEDGEYGGEPDMWAEDLLDAAGKMLEKERE